MREWLQWLLAWWRWKCAIARWRSEVPPAKHLIKEYEAGRIDKETLRIIFQRWADSKPNFEEFR